MHILYIYWFIDLNYLFLYICFIHLSELFVYLLLNNCSKQRYFVKKKKKVLRLLYLHNLTKLLTGKQ